MASKKDIAIDEIFTDFEKFANLALLQLDLLEQQISLGIVTLTDELSAEIDENERKLDKLEVKISDNIVNTIALYQPLASDIRKLFACYRIVINLERIGDLVTNIVRNVQSIKSPELYSNLSDMISNMLMQSSNMVNKSLLSFTNNDKEFAIWTIKNDSVIDEINHKMLKKVIKKSDISDENKQLVTSFITLNGMIANIERIADYATNIAEAAIYSIEGKDIRHKKDFK